LRTSPVFSFCLYPLSMPFRRKLSLLLFK
jgi:hypothetical protein